MTEHIPTAERLAAEAFVHEHRRLYDALLAAEHLADLAGHANLEATLREARHAVGAELAMAGRVVRVDRGPDGR